MYQTHSDFVIVEWSNKVLRKIHFRVILISKYSCTDEQKIGTNRPQQMNLSVRRTKIVGRTVCCNVPCVLIIVLFVNCVSAIMLFVFSVCCLHCYYASKYAARFQAIILVVFLKYAASVFVCA